MAWLQIMSALSRDDEYLGLPPQALNRTEVGRCEGAAGSTAEERLGRALHHSPASPTANEQKRLRFLFLESLSMKDTGTKRQGQSVS